jgi:hypothetical protein
MRPYYKSSVWGTYLEYFRDCILEILFDIQRVTAASGSRLFRQNTQLMSSALEVTYSSSSQCICRITLHGSKGLWHLSSIVVEELYLDLVCCLDKNTPRTQIKVQFKRIIISYSGHKLKYKLIHNSGPKFKFLFICARFMDHSSSPRKQWLDSRI